MIFNFHFDDSAISSGWFSRLPALKSVRGARETKRGCVKMYVNMHFDALSLFNEKGPVLSQARAFVVT